MLDFEVTALERVKDCSCNIIGVRCRDDEAIRASLHLADVGECHEVLLSAIESTRSKAGTHRPLHTTSTNLIGG